MKKTAIVAVMLILAIVMAGCERNETTGAVALKDDIKIGAILFLTGTDYTYVAEAFREGIDLAVEQINNASVLDRPLTVIYEDDQLNPKKAVTAAEKLVNVDEVSAGMMGLMNTAKAAGPLFNDKGIPLVMLWDAKIPGIGLDNLDSLIGIGFSTKAAGEDMADYAYHQLGLRKIAVVWQPDEWSQRISAIFSDKFVQEGGTVVIKEAVDLGESDFKTVILKVKEAEGIYAPFVANLDIFMRRARELGYSGTLISGDPVTEEVIKNSAGAAEGMYFTQIYESDTPKMNEFKKVYEHKYGKKPELSVFAALGYDGVYLIADAIKRAGSAEPEAITQALYQTKNFEGAISTVTIDEFGGSPKSERIFTVKDGSMVLVN